MITMFFKVKEFAFHSYIKSGDPEQSGMAEGGGHPLSIFSKLEPEGLELKVL